MKIKNVRPGILIIADAGLKLAPGDSVEVVALTPQMESAVSAKALVVTGRAEESKPQSRSASKPKENQEKPKEEVKPEGSEADKPEGATPESADSAGNAGAQGLLADMGEVTTKESDPLTRPAGAKSGAK